MFGVIGLAGFGLYLCEFGGDPRTSDDPYLAGRTARGSGRGGGRVSTLLETIVRRPIIVDFLYFGLLGLWTFFLLVSLIFGDEGRQHRRCFWRSKTRLPEPSPGVLPIPVSADSRDLATAGGVVMLAAYVVVASNGARVINLGRIRLMRFHCVTSLCEIE